MQVRLGELDAALPSGVGRDGYLSSAAARVSGSRLLLAARGAPDLSDGQLGDSDDQREQGIDDYVSAHSPI